MQVGSLSVEARVKGAFVTLTLESEDFAFEEDMGLSDIEMMIRHLENAAQQMRDNEIRGFDIG